MERRITVRYHTNSRGTGKLRAKGGGLQTTIDYPHEAHHSMKYWLAAEVLVRRLERANEQRLRLVRREHNDSTALGASSETFVFEVFNETVPRFGNRDAVKYDRLPAGYAN